MTDDLFQTALAFYWRPENDGQGYHSSPSDRGGSTSWGATFSTYCAWLLLHQPEGPGGTIPEFAAMHRNDFQPFYRSAFWNPIQGDQLPSGLGLVVFDAACMSGVTRAARWLQRAIGAVPVDGEIGPVTMGLATHKPVISAITAFTNLRRQFYNDIVDNDDSQARFLAGWLRRAADCQIAGIQAAGKAPVSV